MPSGLGLIYDTLMTDSMDEVSTEYGLLAESLKFPADFSSVTYRLRANAKWHDGEPVTAAILAQRLEDYLGASDQLPYLRRVVEASFPELERVASAREHVVIGSRIHEPCLLELIWCYWHEEGMLMQTMNAISQRFQNVRRLSDRDPLLNLEIDPLLARARVEGRAVVSDDVPKEIVIQANQLGARLILMHAARRSLPHRFLYGNPIEQVLRNAPCDVAVYRGPR